MRIVAGELGSLKIRSVPGDSTRPTTDKVKEAIYSRIGPYFQGGCMLDLFGGSGNMGLEALSRGMDEVYFCDNNIKAIQTIRTNAQSLGVQARCHIMKKDFRACLADMTAQNMQFDLIYVDPPYRKQWMDEILQTVDREHLLKPGGHIICESLKEDHFQDYYGDLIKQKDVTYGITRITYYTRSEV